MKPSDEKWFILNAIECWLYHFPDHKWTPQYVELRDAFQQSIQNSDPESVEEERTQTTSRRPPRKTKAQTSEE